MAPGTILEYRIAASLETQTVRGFTPSHEIFDCSKGINIRRHIIATALKNLPGIVKKEILNVGIF
jgi:hypothetical protein